MLSAKGQSPILIKHTTLPAVSATAAASSSVGLADIDAPNQTTSARSEAQTGNNTLFPSPAERAAFIEKFQSWRRDHAAG